MRLIAQNLAVTGILERADAALGDVLERVVTAHHRRRLKRTGRLLTLDTPAGGWADGDPPPRAGSQLEVLVDGAEALPRIAQAIENARSHVWIAGWFFSPSLKLDDDGPTLRELLAQTAERVEVRILGWAGAPLPFFHPDRREVRAMREELVRDTRIEFALDARERPMHCHHEKLAVVDGETAFVGGIDLTTFSGDRFDTRRHPQREGIGWHDATSRLRGPAVADVADHFRLRWHEVTGEQLPATDAPGRQGELDVQVVRTVPEGIYDAVPRGEFRILESYLRALRSAQRLVYLENQFLWSPEIVAVLADKLRNPPSDDFRLLVVLPAKPKSGAEETRGQLGVLLGADDGAGRFLACTIRQCGPASQPVYVHAKIGIVDDRWLTLGSANLNEHSLFNDTEMNVTTWDEGSARGTRLRLWAEHLECEPREVDDDATDVVDERWRPLAVEQLRRQEAGLPPTRKLVLLPNVSRRSAGVLGPINGFLVDG
jgi:phosphatidylserine/phosphatidylglycerophosphate/cardiolipin synthase-like enzyme